MTLQRLIKRGDLGTYLTPHGQIYSAIVRHVHHDGEITVEMRHEIRNGQPLAGYVGGKIRLRKRDLHHYRWEWIRST
jgi:hypothetical protein